MLTVNLILQKAAISEELFNSCCSVANLDTKRARAPQTQETALSGLLEVPQACAKYDSRYD